MSVVTAEKSLQVLSLRIEPLVLAEGTETGWITGDTGLAAPPHAHPWRETYMVFAGSMDVMVDGETTTVSAGETITVPAGSVHSVVNNADGTKMFFVGHDSAAFPFFEDMAASVTTFPPDLDVVRSVAARHRVTPHF